ncbi:MAG: 4Fe-4S dicluster domain-containing protein [Deltaproteobacteria bacterium]|nr:4Fe-4S dicluster domain-containing protein [Deltaproteobacteria bacterium]
MGHLSLKHAREALRRRLDNNPVGAPPHKALYEILSMLFSDEEAAIAAALPYGFSSTRRIAGLVERAPEELEPVLDRMADKGLLFDIRRDGKALWYLNPLVIGFFEFSMMRIRPELDQKALAHLVHEYALEDPARGFMHELGKGGETQLFRPLVHEENSAGEPVEVLDFERATNMISEAGAWSIGLCHCRHVKLHMDRPCRNSTRGVSDPLAVCLSLGGPAKFFARRGMARAVEKEEALDVLAGSRSAGLVQLGDNVKQKGAFMCNCCGCCCEVLEGYRMLRESPMVMTSGFLPEVAEEKCNGCNNCVRACPVQALSPGVAAEDGSDKEKPPPVLDAGFCLGCGVCGTKCNRGAIRMERGPRQVHTPADMMEKMLHMALDRGKLQYLVFDAPEKVSHKAARAFIGAMLNLPPGSLLLANRQIRSRFISFLASSAPVKDVP